MTTCHRGTPGKKMSLADDPVDHDNEWISIRINRVLLNENEIKI